MRRPDAFFTAEDFKAVNDPGTTGYAEEATRIANAILRDFFEEAHKVEAEISSVELRDCLVPRHWRIGPHWDSFKVPHTKPVSYS